MNKLTPLQRLGISHLLTNFRFHGNQWFESGKIMFRHNKSGKQIEMYVLCYERVIEIHFTLTECENIDTSLEYKCIYDAENLMFRIVEIEEKAVEC